MVRVITKLQEGVRSRLGQVENSTTLATAAFLDPCFKLNAFQNTAVAEATKKHVISLVAAQAESKEKLATSAEEASADSQEHQQADEDEDDDLSIWGTIKNNITTKKPAQK